MNQKRHRLKAARPTRDVTPTLSKVMSAARVVQIRRAYSRRRDNKHSCSSALDGDDDGRAIYNQSRRTGRSSIHSAIMPSYHLKIHSCPCAQYVTESFTLFNTGSIWPEDMDDELVRLEEADEHYFAYGEVSQLWRRQSKTTGQMVAVKGFRMTQGRHEVNDSFEDGLVKLTQQWRQLNHPNVMPCLGTTSKFGLIASLVMPLCPDGPINEYVKQHSPATRLSLLSQVAEGVAYLHSQGVVHGKICGKNIVIAPNGRPLITDMGLSQVIRTQEGLFPWALPSESLRWMAPEVFDPEIGNPFSQSSDVWSLGMTILEVMSGRMPYHPRRLVHATAIAIMDGILPERPDNNTVPDDLWDVLHMLWVQNPDQRPCAAFVQWQLEALRSDNLHHLYKL